jgi:hypothetical protein
VQSPVSKSPLNLDSSILPSVAAAVVAAASAILVTMAAALSVGTVGAAGTVGTTIAGTPPPGTICLFLRLNPGSLGAVGGAGPSPSVVGAASKIKYGYLFTREPLYNS